MYWFEYHGIDAPDGVKLPSEARAYCPPPQYVVEIIVTVANVTAVPPDWPHLLAGLDAEATQQLPKQAVVGLDVTCGNATHTSNSTSLRPRAGELARVPVSVLSPAPAPAPGPGAVAPVAGGAAAQLRQGTPPPGPGHQTSAQALRTVNGSLTLDPSTNRTTTLSAWGPGIQIVGFSRIATVAGTWGWVSGVSYPEPHGLVSSSNPAEPWYYGDYNINENLAYDVTWLDACPRNTRVIAVEVRSPSPAQPWPGGAASGACALWRGCTPYRPELHLPDGLQRAVCPALPSQLVRRTLFESRGVVKWSPNQQTPMQPACCGRRTWRLGQSWGSAGAADASSEAAMPIRLRRVF